MSQKILITRLVGLGDVASILIPAVGFIRAAHPESRIDVLTYQAGIELMSLHGGVGDVLGISEEQWPRDVIPATQSFLEIAKLIALRGYDRIVCLDTWFMPCFLARVLKDIGMTVEGNHIDRPVAEFFEQLHGGRLPADYFQHTNYLASTYPAMADWQKPWWLGPHGHTHYPDFYLRHCCGFNGPLDMRLPIEPDLDFRQAAQGRKIIAVSFKGSTTYKHYPHADTLIKKLQDDGHVVWGRFDGSQPMRTTLARLAASDLLITVATSTQWLARLVGCPSLMLPGAMHPATLGAEITVDQVVDCQYCCQQDCPAGRNFACTDVPVHAVMEKLRAFLA